MMLADRLLGNHKLKSAMTPVITDGVETLRWSRVVIGRVDAPAPFPAGLQRPRGTGPTITVSYVLRPRRTEAD